MCLVCDVTKKMVRDEFTAGPREGSYIHGLFMEVPLTHPPSATQGARWDINTGAIGESKLKELHPAMPVMYVKAVTQDISVSLISKNKLIEVLRDQNCTNK